MKNIDEYDEVEAPRHYIERSATIEPIELLRHAPFDLGNAIKYMIRAKLKGNELQDMKKARWYLECSARTCAAKPGCYATFVSDYGLLLAKFLPTIDFSSCFGYRSYLEALSKHVEHRIALLEISDGAAKNGTEN